MRKPAPIAMLAGAAAICAASDVTACQTPVMPPAAATTDKRATTTADTSPPQGRRCG